MINRHRNAIGLALVLLTIAIFAYYISGHTYLLTKLGDTSLLTIVIVFLLYLGWFASLVMIVAATLNLCRIRLSLSENSLLNAYSTLVNFFVPGQSGPLMRGAYLKKRHNLSIKKYVFASLLYFAFYAFVSAAMLLVFSRPWWQTFLGITASLVLGIAVLKIYRQRKKVEEMSIDWSLSKLSLLMLATCLQAVFQVAIYAVELHSVNSQIHLTQAITYTGAANFALFVALTPGGIGIRESFLLFSRHLHHVSSANIVAASVIDRSVFLLFLALLFILTLAFHARDRFRVKAT
jgi:uncharacterized membrane protein YbhN (UPF0104 family)